MRYVVLGATGTIGRNLTERLGKAYPGQVTAVWHERPPVDIAGVSWARADLRSDEAVRRLLRAQDVVIQAAAVTSGAKDIVTCPHIHVTDNAVMNSLLLRACHDIGVQHFIFFSCIVVYGARTAVPLREDDFTGVPPDSPHFGAAWTKVYIENMCRFFSGLGRIKCTVLRHSNIYGPYDKYDPDHSHMFGATIAKVAAARDGESLAIWGPGTEKRDLLYVDDLTDLVMTCLGQTDPFVLVNVGRSEAWSVNEIVEKIISISGKRLHVIHKSDMPHIPISPLPDCSLCQRLFGWKAKTSLEVGIRKTLTWYLASHAPTSAPSR